MATLAQDTFNRGNISGNWGAATDGNSWLHLLGSSALNVTNHEGIIVSTPNTWDQMVLGSSSNTALDVKCRCIPNVAADMFGVILRASTTKSYMCVYDGSGSPARFYIYLNNNGISTLSSATFSVTVGQAYWVRATALGTTIQAKIWQDGTAEPSNWTITLTNSVLTSGSAGVIGNSNGSGIQYDSFLATDGNNGSLVSVSEQTLTASEQTSILLLFSTSEQAPTESEQISVLPALAVNEQAGISEQVQAASIGFVSTSEQAPTESEQVSVLSGNFQTVNEQASTESGQVALFSALSLSEQSPSASEQIQTLATSFVALAEQTHPSEQTQTTKINLVATSEQAPTESEQVAPVLINLVATSEQAPTGSEQLLPTAITVSDPNAQMISSDLTTQYSRIKASATYSRVNFIATTYYGNVADKSQQGELDVVMKNETIAQMHVLRTINNVTTFLRSYSYMSSVLQDAPLAYYRLGDGPTGIASDLSGNNEHAQIVGGVTTGQPGAIVGDSNTAMLFDGSTGYVTVPANVNTDGWNMYSIELWIWLSNISFSGSVGVVSNDTPNGSKNGLSLDISSTALALANGYGSSSTSLNPSYAWSQQNWYHVVATFDNAALKLYVNGTLLSQTASSGNITAAAYPLNVARNPALSSYFPGELDEVALYSYALPAARILFHYQVGTAILS